MSNKEETSIRAGVIEPEEKENTIKVTKAKGIVLEKVIENERKEKNTTEIGE